MDVEEAGSSFLVLSAAVTSNVQVRHSISFVLHCIRRHSSVSLASRMGRQHFKEETEWLRFLPLKQKSCIMSTIKIICKVICRGYVCC